MTNQMIRRFSMDGEFLETKYLQTRQAVLTATVVQMKDEGFVPLLDVNPTWLTHWLGEDNDKYTFQFTMQGVYVGKEKAWGTFGVMDGKLIPSSDKNK